MITAKVRVQSKMISGKGEVADRFEPGQAYELRFVEEGADA